METGKSWMEFYRKAPRYYSYIMILNQEKKTIKRANKSGI